MLITSEKYLAVIVLWAALLALTSVVVRELGFAKLKRYWLTLLVLVAALASLPMAGVLKLAQPYRKRIAAILTRKVSPAIVFPGGCRMFPQNNIWNARVDRLPVDPSSRAYIQTMGPDIPLHGDFGATFGIPYTVTHGSAKQTVIEFIGTPAESDPGPYAIPDDTPVEDGPDAHVVAVDTETCRLYELYGVQKAGPRHWKAGSGAIFDLRSNSLRPDSWTSADAAGLPILPGLLRFDEVQSGEIRHALRFTTRSTRKAYVWPARHKAAYSNDPNLPPMGQRFRLRMSFDASGLSAETQVIIAALKQYGLMLADNGGPWFVTGSPDSRWSSRIHSELRRISGSDFEAVDTSSLKVSSDSGEARTPPAP